MDFAIADHTHEAVLRDMCRTMAMPGWVRVAYAREPDFFAAASVAGSFQQTLIATQGGRLAAFGCRSVRQVYLNGNPLDLGYLSSLRLQPWARNHTTLAHGYRFLHRLHEDGRTPAYLSTIVAGNTAATGILTSDRAGLPHYQDLGRYITYAISLPARQRHRLFSPQDLVVETGAAAAAALPEIVTFLNRFGAQRQFFPVLDPGDFGTPRLRDLRPEDFCVARRQGQIQGVAACWDQSRFKQHLVCGYAWPLQQLRPLANLGLRLAGRSQLPAPGQNIPQSYISFVCVRDDRPETLAAVLHGLLAHAQASEHSFALLGLHESDPLRQALQWLPAFQYHSQLYLVLWPENRAFGATLEPQRIPYLDLATL